ncbi:MAG TPA: hypothetical protein DHI91_00165 [Candidatus Portnoybacteria bacterium]|uniref:POTRA domain-containing protein n=1 Tax=Candidatus Portnoybacteria bacterium CG02_land_8_20_14_3_00_45_8 TaxID=1974807 RepID=A0A2M7D5V3_9BACT|nr:MAG: hypothetical protein COS30_02470 [Candidatus Portnoybacteria bacterium CG02_land_8_20_14_3_00_45_8]HCX27541.1 hypothetical protein [Candidatus Portnoybacteria bacterium]
MFFSRRKRKKPTPPGFAVLDFPESRRKTRRKIKLKFKLPELKTNRRVLLWTAGIILLLGGLVYFFVWSPVFKVREIKISGVNFVPEEQVRQKTQDFLQKRAWKLIPQDSVFVFPIEKFKKSLLTDWPAIESVKIKIFPPRKLEISLVERAMAAVWCQSKAVLAEEQPTATSSPAMNGRVGLPQSEQCFFADRDGLIFREAPEISGTLLVTFYSRPGQNVVLASQAVSSSTIQFADQVKKQAREMNIDILGFLLGKQGSTDLIVATQEGWAIYLSEERSPAVQLKVLQALLDSEIKGKRSTLNYVDLRTINRVYYR